MYRCPHCDRPGVGFFAKLLSNPIYPAICGLCRQASCKCARVMWTQLCIGIGFLAIVPNIASTNTTYLLGTITAIIIIGVGQIGPLCRQ